MKSLDVLYTPLDCPAQPEFDVDQLKDWIAESYPKQAEFRNMFAAERATAEGKVNNYPWNLTMTFFNFANQGPGWMNGFDQKFPKLSEWMTSAFGISLSNVGLIILLPVKDEHVGQGFWHNDVDVSGLRFYLEFEDMVNNKLLMKRTRIPYDARIGFEKIIIEKEEEYFQPETIECKILSNKQCFYLNNVRAVHSIWTGVTGKSRIAAFVVPKRGCEGKIIEETNELIVRSAEKYKPYSVFWEKDLSNAN